jgi:PhoU domain
MLSRYTKPIMNLVDTMSQLRVLPSTALQQACTMTTFYSVVTLASGIFRDSIRAFADGDCELARTLKFKDRELDDAIDEVMEPLSARASLESCAARSCLDLIFIARALERIGDNATSIAEDSFWRDQMIFVIPILQKRRNPIRVGRRKDRQTQAGSLGRDLIRICQCRPERLG